MTLKKPSTVKKILVALALGLPVALLPSLRSEAVVSDTDTQTITALGNGVTTNYTIGFTFQDNDTVHVYREEQSTTPYTRTEILQGAGASKFTITGGDPGTTVVMGTAPTATQRLIIKRVTAHTQTVDYVETDAFPAEDHEEAMDKLTLLLQEIDARVDTKVGLSEVSTATTPTFPDPYADRFVLYNHAGDDLTLAPTEATSLVAGEVLKYSGSAWNVFDLDGALADMQTDIDGKVEQTDFDAHVAATSVHGATSANTASRIVARDGSGNFSAGTITATLSGTATNVSGTVAIANGGSGQTTATAAFDALSPLTTKGDVLTRNGANNIRVPVGADGFVLMADSAQASGLRWASGPAATSAVDNNFTINDNADPTIQVDFDSAGTTGTKTTLTSSQTANRVLTLPDATDTLVGKATTDTLTNKTINASNNTLSNIADASISGTAAITRSKLANGTANHVLINSGAGVMTSEATLAKSRGGTGADNSGVTFPSSGTIPTLEAANTFTAANAFIDSLDITDAVWPGRHLAFDVVGAAGTAFTTFSIPSTGGVNKTITFPNAATTLVGTDTTDTLTNKTINASSNTLSNIVNSNISASAAIARSKIATGTAYGAVTNDSSGALTSVAPGTANNVLKSDGTQWTSGSVSAPNLTVASKTSAYTVTSSDDLVLGDATSAAFTLTLPAAASNTGKVFRLQKTDSSVNVVTVDGNASETIRGQLTFKLATQYEQISIVSDGTNWQLISHEYSRSRVSASSDITFSGFGTTASASLWAYRDGDSLVVDGYFVSGTAAASTAQINLPSKWAMDSAKMGSRAQSHGVGYVTVATASGTPAVPSHYVLHYDGSTTNTIYFGQTAQSAVFNKRDGNNVTATGSGDLLTFRIRFPVANWEG